MRENALYPLFDRVWVVSLKACEDRRRHIARHLPAMGFTDYRFFDATSADDPSVMHAQESGEVMQYPPCFRCGQLDCGEPDCNNFLIPAQIANFLTYRRLWRTIADGDAERVLIMEDDVFLHPHTERVLRFVAAEVDAGNLPFTAGRACLLRLGWAKCTDHDRGDQPCRIDDALGMSNPCHAMTRDYARALLARDTGIRHTSDVYINQLAPRPGEAFTVHPPIASELSWTEGEFDSTIHPKQIRADRLRAQGDEAAAHQEEMRCTRHVKKKYFRPLLFTGHPRCGTGYAAGLCQQLGLDVGHERLGAAGISSWMFTVDADENPWGFDPVAKTRRAFAWQYLVMHVRDIRAAAPSVMRETQHAPVSWAFRREHILRALSIDLEDFGGPLERAVWSITSWARMILAQHPSLVFRIEDESEKLRDFLVGESLIEPEARSTALDTSAVNADKLYKGVRHPKPEISPADWDALPVKTRDEVDWYCERFGYAG